ncbi:MAG TPA: M36 family metallopeptidase [Pyrinomonadaceae bacterium]
MQKSSTAKNRRGLLLSLFVLGLIAALMTLPYQFRSEAGAKKNSRPGLIEKTVSHADGLENYDIRADKTAFEKIAGFRQAANKGAAEVADLRADFVKGEQSLRQRVPTLKIEYNSDIRTPEVVAPDVRQGSRFLTGASTAKRSEILRGFAKENNSLIGATDVQLNSLKVTADYTNPDGNLSFAHLEQFINDVPVFRGEIKAGFTRQGEIVRVINNLAPGLDYNNLSNDFRDPLDAVKKAAGYINLDANSLDLARNEAASNNLKVTFGTGDSATLAEKMYFPTEPGVAVPSWRVLIWQPVNAYYIIVDAETGTLLWRKNLTEDQTQAATYGVYANPNAMINVADNPFPMTPGPLSPGGTQGAPISRASITRIGNEAPYTFNNNGWITDGGTRTDGNAVQAGLDRDAVDGVDLNSEAVNASRSFTYTYTPFNPNTNTGEVPVPASQTYPGTAFQQGTVTQMFYIMNWYHDEMYRLGFTEQARNFQHSNFGRGGLENDRIRGEGQDSSGFNNANFATADDGTRGRMQMYLWSGPNPDIDGNLDAEVVIHEVTHGTSNRLHGNASGLTTNMSRGMGEGWSDFYAHSLLSEPSDPINGIYTTGAYDTYQYSNVGTNNYYYGIRRFPKAVMAFTGGPNNRPHNPLTFADLDAATININNGAFAPSLNGASADQVHNAGEIWSSALWEIRAKFIARLGWAAGNRKILQLVTDGMKLAPLGPTFITERDAIVAAAVASGTAEDAADIWAGFAIRGIGFSASIQNPGNGTGDTRVTESFDLPNLLQTPTFSFSDAAGNNNGFADPGETLAINVPLWNITGIAANNVTLQLVGGGSANYGTLAHAVSASQPVSYTVPANTACGSAIFLTFNVNSSLGAISYTRPLLIGNPNVTYTENFDGAPAPAFPAGWTASAIQGGVAFVTTTANSDSAPNSAYAADPTTVGGGTDLTSPSIPITAPGATVSFRNRYDTETGWDGGVLEISIAGGAFQDILTAGGFFLEGGYNQFLGIGTNNPLSNRPAWSGFTDGYTNTKVVLPATAAGQNIRLRFRFGADNNTTGFGPNPGWNIDGIQIAGSYNCAPLSATVKSRADFDGDGKTDLSVFRPSDTVWYLQRSQAGFTAVQFGVASDVLTPGDYDGDGKADIAVWRPSSGTWYRLNSSNGTFVGVQFGANGDVPQAGDFDGDTKDDLVVWRPTDGTWYRLNSLNGSLVATQFGANGDRPVGGDYDGDGKDDLAVFRPADGTWYRVNSSNGVFSGVSFGLSSDLVAPADYDGDNKEDICVFRPSDGTWYRLNSNGGGLVVTQFGANGDVPVPGDYDGDGKDDQAVFRNGTWYLNRSTAGFAGAAFGIASDRAVPKYYLP